MISPKSVLMWIAAGILFVSVGLFTIAATDQQAMAAGPPASSISEPAEPQVQSETPAGDEQPCSAEAAEQQSTPSEAAIPMDAICGPGASWTCCRCGGCGCRPTNISPTNWCAC
jgi:hypothetical protein